MQAESRIYQGVFLHIIPVCISSLHAPIITFFLYFYQIVIIFTDISLLRLGKNMCMAI